jgi:hypothetical protein
MKAAHVIASSNDKTQRHTRAGAEQVEQARLNTHSRSQDTTTSKQDDKSTTMQGDYYCNHDNSTRPQWEIIMISNDLSQAQCYLHARDFLNIQGTRVRHNYLPLSRKAPSKGHEKEKWDETTAAQQENKKA